MPIGFLLFSKVFRNVDIFSIPPIPKGEEAIYLSRNIPLPLISYVLLYAIYKNLVVEILLTKLRTQQRANYPIAVVIAANKHEPIFV